MCIILALLPFTTSGRLLKLWSYQELFDASDIVLIGKPASTVVTTEVTNVVEGIPFVGLSSKIAIRMVMKGKKDLKTLVLQPLQAKVLRALQAHAAVGGL